MKRLTFAGTFGLILILSAALGVQVQAGGMKEKEGMMKDLKTDAMSEKDGGMMHDQSMKAMSEGAMKEDMGGMLPKTRTGALQGSKGHSASGRAILTDGDMGPVLVLENIEIDKVPDGRVYLARDADYRDGVELGHLKQFEGTVTFAVPAEVNPAEFNSVVIWCKKFDVEIGRATLAQDKM